MDGDRRWGLSRRVRAILYAPWACCIVWPWLAVSTAIGAIVAVGLHSVRPSWAVGLGVLWSRALVTANLSRVSLAGFDRVPRGQACILVANHQSHFDVPAFWSRWPLPFRFVMKEELRRVPFLGWGSAVLGMVFVDRKDRAAAMASLRAARPLLDRGVSLLFFAEGTRSPDGRLQPFKKGGFVTAMDAGLPILPVSISGTHRILPGRRMSLLPGRARITVHDPIPTAGLAPSDLDGLVERVRIAIASGLTPYERGEA